MQITIEKQYRFIGGKTSILHNGDYLFSPNEAKRLGLDNELEEYSIHKLEYGDNLQKAIEIMPDYECFDSDKKVLLKTTKPKLCKSE